MKPIRRRSFNPGGSRQLNRILREVDRLRRPRPRRRLDLTRIEAEVAQLVADVHRRGVTAASGDDVDAFVDSYVSELKLTAHADYVAGKNELRVLLARLNSYLTTYRQVADHDAEKLEHLRMAVAHTLALLVDDDLPIPSPLRSRRTSR